MSAITKLGTPCSRCGALLELLECEDQMVACPSCPDEPAEGATVADALDAWQWDRPAPVRLGPLASVHVLRRTPWVIECDGLTFDTLTDAENYNQDALNGGPHPIFCRLKDAS